VWLEDIHEPNAPALPNAEQRPFVMIGGLEIAGSRWQAAAIDSAARLSGTTMTLNSVNTVDNADDYVPPFDPGRTVNGNQEVLRREQSLALEFTNLGPGTTLEAFKTFSLDEDYSRYDNVRSSSPRSRFATATIRSRILCRTSCASRRTSRVATTTNTAVACRLLRSAARSAGRTCSSR
jgi:hypothetical protein